MAQGSPDAREKLGGADRLGQIIIRAEVERTYLFLFLRAGGEDDDRDAGPGADLADDLHAEGPQFLNVVVQCLALYPMIGSASFPVCAVEMR